ncbi:MAG TPA: hypothetical protein VHZ54_03365 [Solirubrobacterales bacterium]|nr:hypothetical protein [Solirubrobacterales bacterium]
MSGRARGDDLGPVQVLSIGLDARGSDRMLAAELQDLGTQDGIRVLDVLRVRRGYDDELLRLDPLDHEDHSGDLVEALLVVEPEEGEATDAAATLESEVDERAWFLADRVPRGAAAAILLIEHRWAIPLREATADFGAEVFGDAWVHPRDLAAALAHRTASG